MPPDRTRCLILAAGNTLRSDDGVGPYLAEWAADHFDDRDGVRVLSRQQWTPELAEDVAQADAVVFVDSSAESAPGAVQLAVVEAAASTAGIATHHLSAEQLLGLCLELYPSMPSHAFLLTIGMGSTEMGSTFSGAMQAALPEGQALLRKMTLKLIGKDDRL